ncbi:MAG: amino acid racemase, partial [Oscillospiraceae bacterium]|nr:amino acid racemase [Oscillospiraceae bacterium]
GGVGPMATVYFEEMVLEMTDAGRDQEHVNMLVYNHASIPDRTAFILNASDQSPLPQMVEDARMLERAGCDFLVLPCNTAHFFHQTVQEAVSIPLLNIVEETVRDCAGRNMHSIGVLATEGTVTAGTYDDACGRYGLSCIYPDPDTQRQTTSVIYDYVKAGRPVKAKELLALYSRLRDEGCDGIVLGCTELSVAHRDLSLRDGCPDVVDSLEVLARRTIEQSGKQVRAEFIPR